MPEQSLSALRKAFRFPVLGRLWPYLAATVAYSTLVVLFGERIHPSESGRDFTAEALLAGVHGVLVGAELPIRYGIIPWTQDEQALAADKARYVGDGVAAVAAIDEDTANEAIDLIEVEYEVLPALLDPAEAAKSDVIIHDYDETKAQKKGNISKHVDLSFGVIDEALAEADVVVSGE